MKHHLLSKVRRYLLLCFKYFNRHDMCSYFQYFIIIGSKFFISNYSLQNIFHGINLQDDLNKLVHWSTIWLMPFNFNKCKPLIITNKLSPSVYNYKLNDHTIQRVQAAKYLGLIILHNLS